MTQPTPVPDRINAIRTETVAFLETVVDQALAFELPAPPDALANYRRKLLDNTYQALVAGEAKRGKSTFVNALIGRDILPTDVDVATSQVFRIRQAEREAYRLRFEDDSERPIDLGDLPRFGSQVVTDAQGTPRLDQIIRWIEVDGPIRFLPPGMSILDTPGLGTLYAAHAQITQRFVPLADAVVFVLDSQRPVSQEELLFIDSILRVTRDVFFIQTKIDLFRKEHWQEVQNRNHEVLRQRFGGRLADPRVWPISSTNLRKAALTGDEDYLMVSRHRELAAALQAFLFRVAGWSRSAEALLLADHYHTQSGQALAGRHRALLEESRQKQAEFQQQASQRKQRFEADWGERGQKHRELVEGVRKIASLGKVRMNQALRAGGDVSNGLQARIDALDSLDAARALGSALADDFAAAALETWRQVREKARGQCAELLTPFYADADAVLTPPGDDPEQIAVAASCPDLQADWVGRWRGATMAAMGVTSTLTVLKLMSLTALITPLAAVAAPVTAWLIYKGWKSSSDAQWKGIRQELSRHLEAIRRQVAQQFLEGSLETGRFSLVEEYFSTLERTIQEQVARVRTLKAEEARAEVERLAEQARLNDQERKAQAERVHGQMEEWGKIGRSLKALGARLRELDRATTPAPAATR